MKEIQEKNLKKNIHSQFKGGGRLTFFVDFLQVLLPLILWCFCPPPLYNCVLSCMTSIVLQRGRGYKNNNTVLIQLNQIHYCRPLFKPSSENPSFK